MVCGPARRVCARRVFPRLAAHAAETALRPVQRKHLHWQQDGRGALPGTVHPQGLEQVSARNLTSARAAAGVRNPPVFPAVQHGPPHPQSWAAHRGARSCVLRGVGDASPARHELCHWALRRHPCPARRAVAHSRRLAAAQDGPRGEPTASNPPSWLAVMVALPQASALAGVAVCPRAPPYARVWAGKRRVGARWVGARWQKRDAGAARPDPFAAAEKAASPAGDEWPGRIALSSPPAGQQPPRTPANRPR